MRGSACCGAPAAPLTRRTPPGRPLCRAGAASSQLRHSDAFACDPHGWRARRARQAPCASKASFPILSPPPRLGARHSGPKNTLPACTLHAALA